MHNANKLCADCRNDVTCTWTECTCDTVGDYSDAGSGAYNAAITESASAHIAANNRQVNISRAKARRAGEAAENGDLSYPLSTRGVWY